MPALRELRTRARMHAADLAHLSALTYLRLGAIVVDTQPPPQDAGADRQQQQQPPRTGPVYFLPPQLQRIKTYAPLCMRDVAALRRSPGAPPVSWLAPGLMFLGDRPYWCVGFSDRYWGEDGQLSGEAVADSHRAVASLMDTFSRVTPPGASHDDAARGLHLRVLGSPEAGVGRPPAPGGAAADDGTHCGSWLGAMMARLRPQTLELCGFYLSPRDMLGMTRCLAGLKELDLRGSSYEASSLPLLAGLAAVEQLTLSVEDWEGLDPADDNTEPIEAAFLALTAPAPRAAGWLGGEAEVEALYEGGGAAALPLPRLRRLEVHCDAGPEEERVREALEAATAELGRRRPRPAMLVLRTLEEE